jgi:hypothetical protein
MCLQIKTKGRDPGRQEGVIIVAQIAIVGNSAQTLFVEFAVRLAMTSVAVQGNHFLL